DVNVCTFICKCVLLSSDTKIMIRTRIYFLWFNLLFVSLSYAQPSTDFEIIGNRLKTDLLHGSVDAEHIQQLISSLDSRGMWPSIDYIDTVKTAFEHRHHL